MAATITANNTRVNPADAATNWSNYVGGGPAPAAEPQLRYQGTNAVNRKVNTTSDRRGVEYDPGANAIDMTASGNALWLCKVKVADAADLNTTYGLELRIGSAAAASYEYNAAGSNANSPQFTEGYSSQGGLAEGYLIVAIDPSIGNWHEATGGSPSLTAVDYWACGAQFVAGGAKSENVAMDAIDIGRGLTYTGTDGSFQDAIDEDQNTDTNRWGYACAVGNAYFLRGVHTLAQGTTSLTFDSPASEVCFFPDGYHSQDTFGLLCDLTSASTDINFRGLYAGLGSNRVSEDTRPFFTASGTTGSVFIEGVFQNFRRMEFTSGVVCSGTIGTKELVQQGGYFENAVVRTLEEPGVATMADPEWGRITKTDFIQAASGHAIEINETGAYTLTEIGFQGYGGTAGSNETPSSGPNDAAIYNNSGGAVTINVSDGDSPTVRNAASSTTTVVATVTLTITGLVADSEVRIYTAGTTTELDGVEDSSTSFVFSFENGDPNVDIRIFHLDYQPVNFLNFVLPGTSSSLPVQQIFDRNYENPPN